METLIAAIIIIGIAASICTIAFDKKMSKNA